jgi:hypothetical protein
VVSSAIAIEELGAMGREIESRWGIGRMVVLYDKTSKKHFGCKIKRSG